MNLPEMFTCLLQNMPPERVTSAAEKDLLRSQRYRDEHSKDPEYRAKRAAQAKADWATKEPAKYAQGPKAQKAANLVKGRQHQRGEFFFPLFCLYQPNYKNAFL